ncbi:serine/threonine-protein kinase 4-like isoform X2, partial [Biomphalaria pfeifferi]
MQQEMNLSKFEFDGDGDKNVKNWKKIKQIGCGHFSHVYHAKAFTPDAEWDVAVKEINVKFDKKE